MPPHRTRIKEWNSRSMINLVTAGIGMTISWLENSLGLEPLLLLALD